MYVLTHNWGLVFRCPALLTKILAGDKILTIKLTDLLIKTQNAKLPPSSLGSLFFH